ncbi:hypothetical protein [Endozoicomonas sp. ONNA1]|nr:hypothetical protein [Endozoicomonas sp. ONNA1]
MSRRSACDRLSGLESSAKYDPIPICLPITEAQTESWSPYPQRPASQA